MSTATIVSAQGWTCAVLLLLLAPLAAAGPDVVEVMANFDTTRHATSAAWTGTHAYIFGGHTGTQFLNEIVRYTPSTNEVKKMGATLTTARKDTSAAWTGSVAYVVGGGEAQGVYDNQILKYDPSLDVAPTVAAVMGSARCCTSAAWTGTALYIFGGYEGPNVGGDVNSRVSEILKFDPGTGTVAKVADLPTGRRSTSAVWDGTYAYVFGGEDGTPKALDEIVRFNPANNEAATLSAKLPAARTLTGAAWDGTHAFVFGGTQGSESQARKEIFRFTPGTGESKARGGTLPTERAGASAVWAGSSAYVFGGQDRASNKLKEIVRYTPGIEEASSTESSSGASAAESSSSGAPPQGSQSVSPSSDAIPEKRFSDKGSPAVSGWAALAVVAIAAWAGRRRA